MSHHHHHDHNDNHPDFQNQGAEIDDVLQSPENAPAGNEPLEQGLPDEAHAEKDELSLLKEKVASLEKELAEAADNRLRLLAEMENQRKRALKDMENARLSSLGDAVGPFLQVYDHFSMAVKASEKSDKLQTLLDGMKMISNEFDKAFGEVGIERIEAAGKDFDPNIHEAVSQEASDTVPAGKVIRQWSCGYRTPQRLYKPAMVVVSSGPKKEE